MRSSGLEAVRNQRRESKRQTSKPRSMLRSTITYNVPRPPSYRLSAGGGRRRRGSHRVACWRVWSSLDALSILRKLPPSRCLSTDRRTR
ncbi:hypothetical protein E2C01_036085 [Portunus trituberculatus]|uniref:Uncharacterized protein n=1 Tax=Portunus trituberculatus TaxID=210409 RepID=A0A5B7FBH6_PORTR|nr:hypothetical protein [Portunus trituberculatus]